MIVFDSVHLKSKWHIFLFLVLSSTFFSLGNTNASQRFFLHFQMLALFMLYTCSLINSHVIFSSVNIATVSEDKTQLLDRRSFVCWLKYANSNQSFEPEDLSQYFRCIWIFLGMFSHRTDHARWKTNQWICLLNKIADEPKFCFATCGVALARSVHFDVAAAISDSPFLSVRNSNGTLNDWTSEVIAILLTFSFALKFFSGQETVGRQAEPLKVNRDASPIFFFHLLFSLIIWHFSLSLRRDRLRIATGNISNDAFSTLYRDFLAVDIETECQTRRD